MTYVAGEPISYFWPMRSFIHHNPLQGLEHLPFERAVAEGQRLFHGRGYLPRAIYQRYLAAGQLDADVLTREVERFAAGEAPIAGAPLPQLLMALLTQVRQPLGKGPGLASEHDIHAALHGAAVPELKIDGASLVMAVKNDALGQWPLYASVDRLFCSGIGDTLDELVVKSCLDFFDEGQSVWQMPDREKGLFASWCAVARHNLRLFIRGLHINNILAKDDTPEALSVMS